MLNSIKKYFNRAKSENSKKCQKDASVRSGFREDGSSDYSHASLPKTWIGMDLDGTLSHYDRRASYKTIGVPIPAMMALVKKMINNGIRVKIFTARAQDPGQLPIIRKWLKDNGLPELEITNIKDYLMQRLYDDRCIQVEKNTGRLIVDK